MEENKGLLLKSTMSYGLIMGIFWVIKYLFFIFGYSTPSLIFIYWCLSFAVPFIAYYMTKRYKYEIGGHISFFHAWRFGTMLYFFAALIDTFPCRNDLSLILYSEIFISCAVVTVPGKAV